MLVRSVSPTVAFLPKAVHTPIGSRSHSDSALAGGARASRGKSALKVAERRRRRSGTKVWKYGPPG